MSEEGPCVWPRIGSTTPSASKAPGDAFSRDSSLALSSARLWKDAVSSQRERQTAPHRPWLEQSGRYELLSWLVIAAVLKLWSPEIERFGFLLVVFELFKDYFSVFVILRIAELSWSPDLPTMMEIQLPCLHDARFTYEDKANAYSLFTEGHTKNGFSTLAGARDLYLSSLTLRCLMGPQAVKDESGDGRPSSCRSYPRRQATSYHGPVGNSLVRIVEGSHKSRNGVG